MNSAELVENLASSIIEGTPYAAAEEAALAALGFRNERSAWENLKALTEKESFPGEDAAFLKELLLAVADSFEPDRALNNLERLAESLREPGELFRPLGERSSREALLALLSGSQHLTDFLLQEPGHVFRLLEPSVLDASRPKEEMAAELMGLLSQAGNHAERLSALRRFRKREFLRIGARDLTRRADLPETTADISHLADVCLEGAYESCYRELTRTHGVPRFRDPDGEERECEFTVLAMGKLGGEELNFSSDIDILFLYSSDEGGTEGVEIEGLGRHQQLTNHDFFVKLSQMLRAAMSRITEEGAVFRVDLRLRPEGQSGDIAYSLRSYEIYYESWGQTWERQAMIKVRPAAGSRGLGESFMRTIQPFVYRKHLDFAALDEIRAMKERIDRSLLKGRDALRNVKLGKGGIREVEFIVQAFQMAYGGMEPRIRERNTLKAIGCLGELGLLAERECRGLREAYTFLRELEHRIQITHGLQSHSLPTDGPGLRALARKMGFRGGSEAEETEALLRAHDRHTREVQGVYDNFFYQKRPLSAEGELVTSPLTGEEMEPEELSRSNFQEPEAARERLRLLREGPPFAHVSARAKRTFDAILPTILEESWRLPDADLALLNLERFVAAAGSRETLFELFLARPRVLTVLLHLFSGSEALSSILIRQPALLDSLLDPEVLTSSKSLQVLEGELDESLGRVGDERERLDELRRFKQAEELAIGLRSILGEADILATLDDLSRLAELFLKKALEMARREFQARYGLPREETSGREARFAIIGLGKLGSRELNFGSDLDLLFIYSAQGMTEGTPGPRGGTPLRLTNYDYFCRLGSRVMEICEGLAAAGPAYRVDLRLRPEGRKGALALAIADFERFCRERLETWQRQALVRARPVAGDEELGRAFLELSQGFVYGKPFGAAEAGEIEHMRERLERELAREVGGHLDFKLGRGGIADIEFLVEFLQLRHGREKPALRITNTLRALEALQREGLLGEEEFSHLREGYLFLRNLESRMRIVRTRPLSAFPEEPSEIEALARRLGYADDETGSARGKLLRDYERHTGRVREVYSEVLARPF